MGIIMTTKEVTIQNPSGLQVDLAGEFCDLAMSYDCSVRFFYRGKNEANAKSVLSILGAGIRNDETIEIVCEGEGEQEAVDNIAKLLSGH